MFLILLHGCRGIFFGTVLIAFVNIDSQSARQDTINY